jgi:hypothetical protein
MLRILATRRMVNYNIVSCCFLACGLHQIASVHGSSLILEAFVSCGGLTHLAMWKAIF